MNIVIFLCFTIFIIYFLICFILGYYFIKHRNIWNKTFEIENLFYYFEYIKCSLHSILWIPDILQINKNKDCKICKKEENDNKDKNKIYLHKLQNLMYIYKLLNEIDTNFIPSNKNDLLRTLNMLIWLLEGSIKDYNIIKNEKADIYYKLKETYKNTTSILSNYNSSNTENILSLENISYIENNIELCNKIIENCNTNLFCKKTNFNDEFTSYYLFALFYDINEFIKNINLLFNKICN